MALLSVAFNLVRHRLRKETGSPPAGGTGCGRCGWCASRSSGLSRETAALTVMLCLWIVSGFGGRLDTEPYQTRHYGIMRWFLDLIYRAAGRTCGLRVDGDRHRPEAPANRPLIVLSRHAGPGDSLLLVHHLLTSASGVPASS